MQLFEMQGLLAGKCLPVDMLVGESLSQYFLRQFNQRDELSAKLEIVNGLMDAATELNNLAKENVIALQAKCDALAAENEFIRDEHEQSLGPYACVDLPATKVAIAEIKAQGVDEAALTFHENAFVAFENSSEHGVFIRADLQQFAANLRAGRKG